LSLLKHRYIFFCSYVSYFPEVKIDNKYGIAKILNVSETLFEANPDIKPASLLSDLKTKRKLNEKAKKRIIST
jgi:hypothetical protein